MQKIISSGFIVKGKDGKYLLGKAHSHDEPFCWTIFKGGVEGEESLIETAIRELKEESGININIDDRLNKNISSNPIYTYSLKHKDVYVFLLNDSEGALDGFKFNCESFWSGDKPEISDYGWFTLDEMENKLFHSQKGLIDKLRSMEKRI